METTLPDHPTSNAYDLSLINLQQHEIISSILTEWGTTAFNVRRNLAGKSSASVFLVDINCSDHDGQAILKISESSLNKDIKGMQAALDHAPKIGKSLPKLIKQKSSKNYHAILLAVVGDGFLQADPLSAVPNPILNGAFQKISRLLLEEWNFGAKFSNDYHDPPTILKKFLGYRAEPGARIWDFLREELEIDPDVKTIDVGWHSLPNPLNLLDKECISGNTKQQIVEGLVHGDFHSDNVLIRYATTLQDVFFIDFDSVSTEAPLFFDHSYLELFHLLSFRGQHSYQKWLELCDQLSNVNTQSDANRATIAADDMGLLWSVGMLRGAVGRWTSNEHKARLDDITKQLLLSRVAAGLNFSSKRALSLDPTQSAKKKTLAFIYAAFAAKQYFDLCKIEMSTERAKIAFPGEKEVPTSNDWRKIWQISDDFVPGNGRYVLLASEGLGELTDTEIRTLAKLPWSLIIDLDPRTDGGKASVVMGPELRKIGTFAQLFPSQFLSSKTDVDCLWLYAEDEVPVSGSVWRKAVLPAVREAFRDLYQKATPLPTYLIVMGRNAIPVKLRALYGAAEEEFGGLLSSVVVADGQDDNTRSLLEEESDNLQSTICNWSDFSLSIEVMLGDLAVGQPGTTIPIYDGEKGVVRQQILDPEIAARYLTSVQLVGSGTAGQGVDKNDIGDFFRGNTVTWDELNLRHDLIREGYGGPEGWLNQLRNLLRKNPARSLKVAHSVGAGGTTVARRMAWDLKSEFPVVILNSFNDHTVDDIEYLFHLSRLPVLVVIEANTISVTNRDRLFEGLKSRSARFLLLDVAREFEPKNSTGSIAVPDPMTLKEAERFKSTFQKFTTGERSAALEQLCDPAYVRYRVPFFFGLMAFGKDFVKVGDFVSNVMDNTPSAARRWVAMISLVTRYSQVHLPYVVFRKLIGLENANNATPPTESLGLGVKKALIFDGKGIGVIHPVLAEEFLDRYLSSKTHTSGGQTAFGLTDFCVWVIQELSEAGVKDSVAVQEILIDLFVDRGFWLDSASSNPFSPLISSLPTKEGQKRVLEVLAERFPNNAHFLNHLGRHINFRQSGTFDEAKSAMSKAIEIEPNNSVHHHAMGMVYRLETDRVLKEWLQPQESLTERLEIARPLVSAGVHCFSDAVALSDSSNYPLVSPLQMIFQTLERVLKLGKYPSYGDLLTDETQTGEWCRGLLNDATFLLADLHKLEAGSPHSVYRKRCDVNYQNVLGKYDAMIAGLRDLLRKPGVNKPAIRRMLAQGHIEQHGQVSLVAHKAIADLMLQNLQEAPASDYDMRTWIRSVRKLSNFSVSSSIEKFTEWSLVSDSDEVHYYLYILHFLQAKLGVRLSAKEANEYLSLLRNKPKTTNTKKSYEWLGHSEDTGNLTLVHHSELGEWNPKRGFFQETGSLERIKARISKIKSPQAGAIDIGGLEAFFVPRYDFLNPHDLNSTIECYIGFSYEGPRAWVVERPSGS
jgi:hypothetical protein